MFPPEFLASLPSLNQAANKVAPQHAAGADLSLFNDVEQLEDQLFLQGQDGLRNEAKFGDKIVAQDGEGELKPLSQSRHEMSSQLWQHSQTIGEPIEEP